MNDEPDELHAPEPTAPQDTTALAVIPEPPTEFACVRCGKEFQSAQALRMHRIRVHTAAGKLGAVKGSRHAKKNRAEELAKRREYQQNLRERYYAEGKDSKGHLRAPGWKPRRYRFRSDTPEYKKAKYEQYKQRNIAAGLNARGKPRKSKNVSQAMKESWARRKAAAEQSNNNIEPGATTDYSGEAARAILLAAKVIRGVATSLKLEQ